MTSEPTPRARTIVKSAFARVMVRTGTDALIGALNRTARYAIALGYHRVVENFAAEARQAIPAMLTSRAMLERQLDWIGRRFRFVTLDELGARMEYGGSGPPVAAVTFDDGYRDVYMHALPILRRKGIPAAIFVVTSLVDTRELQIHDRLYLLLTRAFARWADPPRALAALVRSQHLDPGDRQPLPAWPDHPRQALSLILRGFPRGAVHRLMAALEGEVGLDYQAAEGMLPLTWSMLAKMQAAGMSVGSHTLSHAWLTREDPRTIAEEVTRSRLAIEARLGTPVHHFAYPDGRFTTMTARALAAAGYRFAYTTCTHRHPRYPLLSIPRTMLWERACVDALGRFSAAIMSCQVHGVFSLLGGCEQDHGG